MLTLVFTLSLAILGQNGSVETFRVFAAHLLCTPSGIPEPAPPAEDWPALSQALTAVAMTWEILDQKEVAYYFTNYNAFQEDLDHLRERHTKLKNAPLLFYKGNFPHREHANTALAFNRCYHNYLEGIISTNYDRYWWIKHIQFENHILYKVYDAIRDAQCENYSIVTRRTALLYLRDTLGDYNFDRGLLPPCVPIWWFRED